MRTICLYGREVIETLGKAQGGQLAAISPIRARVLLLPQVTNITSKRRSRETMLLDSVENKQFIHHTIIRSEHC